MTTKEIIRIDRNVVDNFDAINRQFKDDAQLVRQIIHFLAFKEQTSLFSAIDEDCDFSIDEFCSFYNVDKKNLLHLHPYSHHEYLLKTQGKYDLYIENEQKDGKFKVMDNVFENALYRLFSESLIFTSIHTYSSQDPVIPESIREMKGVNEVVNKKHVKLSLINMFNVWYAKTTKGQTQVRYSYRLHPDFRNVLNGYYQVVQKPLLTSLSNKDLDGLYLFLLKNYHTAISEKNTTTVCSMDTICNYIKTNVINPSDKKKFITKKINMVLIHMPYITFQWIKRKNSTGESKYAYTLQFTYNNCSDKELDTITERKNMIYEELLICLTKRLQNDGRYSSLKKRNLSNLIRMIENNALSSDKKTRAFFHYKTELLESWEQVIDVFFKTNSTYQGKHTYNAKFKSLLLNCNLDCNLKLIVFEALSSK